jgi:hypothetical protein
MTNSTFKFFLREKNRAIAAGPIATLDVYGHNGNQPKYTIVVRTYGETISVELWRGLHRLAIDSSSLAPSQPQPAH